MSKGPKKKSKGNLVREGTWRDKLMETARKEARAKYKKLGDFTEIKKSKGSISGRKPGVYEKPKGPKIKKFSSLYAKPLKLKSWKNRPGAPKGNISKQMGPVIKRLKGSTKRGPKFNPRTLIGTLIAGGIGYVLGRSGKKKKTEAVKMGKNIKKKVDPMYTKGGPGQRKRKDITPANYRRGGRVRGYNEQYD